MSSRLLLNSKNSLSKSLSGLFYKVSHKDINIPVLCLYVIMGFLLFHCPVSSASQTGEEIEKIQKAYANIKDIRGNFVQKSYIKDLKRTDIYKGQFFIKPPKLKWEYKGDKAQTVYVAGDEVVIYQKKEKQAFKSKFDRATYGQAPIALLGGLGDINKEFEVQLNSSNRPNHLILKPKKTMGNISYVELYTSDSEFPIEALTIIDSLSNKVEILLKDVEINTGLKDRMFEFSPPQGVNVIQQ